jgi:hypothetical protein
VTEVAPQAVRGHLDAALTTWADQFHASDGGAEGGRMPTVRARQENADYERLG